MAERIVIVDDEATILKSVESLLRKEGFSVQAFQDPKKALVHIRKDLPTLVLLDIRMPEMDGYAVLKELKFDVRTRNVPVVIMSTKSEGADVAIGLEMGAVDYVRKPFESSELIARVRSALRRMIDAPFDDRFELGPLVIDYSTRTVTIDGTKVHLTNMEFDLLAYLAKNEGRVITRGTLFQSVWGTDYSSTSRTMDFHLSQLRRKMGKRREWLRILRGIGYQLCVEG